MTNRPCPTMAPNAAAAGPPAWADVSVTGGRMTKQLNSTRSAASTAPSRRRSVRVENRASDSTIQVATPATRVPAVTSGASASRVASSTGAGVSSSRSSAGPAAHSARHKTALAPKGRQVADQLGPVTGAPPAPHRRRARRAGVPGGEGQMAPPGQQHRQRAIDQEEVPVEQPLAVDPRYQVEEPAERGLVADGRQPGRPPGRRTRRTSAAPGARSATGGPAARRRR